MQEDNDIILANALLGCYLDDASTDEIAQVCDRHNDLASLKWTVLLSQ
jgi:hypothetical protein